jgi:hypothetical protein
MHRLSLSTLRHRLPGDRWLDRFQQRLAEAALEIGGFDHLSWNRRITQVAQPDVYPRPVGMADWDGTLYLDRKWVRDPLAQLRRNWGRPQPEPVLRRYKHAVATLLHETYHLVAPPDHDKVEGRSVYDQPSSVFLEEGVTELYTHHRLDDVIRAVGLDEGAPGLCDVQITPSYPDYIPGTRSLLEWTADRLRVPYPQLLECLAGETAAGKFPQLSRLALIHTGLAAAIPEERWWASARAVEQAVRTELDLVAALPPHGTAQATAALSRALGHNAAAAMDHTLTALRGHFLRRDRDVPERGATPTMEVER